MSNRIHPMLAVASSMGLLALAPGCGGGEEERRAEPSGPVGQMVARAADSNRVPRDLMLAIAHVEGGLSLAPAREIHEDEHVPVAGVLELRHGRFNSLARGAELMGMSELELQADLAAGTEAGARVLDDLARDRGMDRGDWGAWASVVEVLSGYLQERDQVDYRARVFKVLRAGGDLPARGGEVIRLPAHDDVPLSLTLAPPGLEPQGGVPEYAGAIWFDTSCANKCDTTRNGNAVSMIAIHDTEGGWDASVATLQLDPGKSVHYIVDRDGSRVGQFIPESYTGWHVGNYHYNQRMVGIEHVGYAGIDDYRTEMYVKSADLVNDIAARNGLEVNRQTLIAHQEVPNPNNLPSDSPPCTDSPGSCVGNPDYGGAGHHTDPGVYWEWCQYMELAGGTCKCNDAYELWNCVHDLSMMVRCPAGEVEIVHCADTCVVEPIGVDDHCTPLPAGTGGGGGAGGSGGAGAGAGGGAGGAPGSGGAPATPGGDAGEDSGCAIGARRRGAAALPSAAALVALAALAARSRRRRCPLRRRSRGSRRRFRRVALEARGGSGASRSRLAEVPFRGCSRTCAARQGSPCPWRRRRSACRSRRSERRAPRPCGPRCSGCRSRSRRCPRRSWRSACCRCSAACPSRS
ncbi:MAG: N-acetylmuramoyl-L-alanine amidase [Polyangiaceae bacterium]|nr:N-acetylmuramoyl-L-alanine amidase [Polyangiaceae bacterium]